MCCLLHMFAFPQNSFTPCKLSFVDILRFIHYRGTVDSEFQGTLPKYRKPIILFLILFYKDEFFNEENFPLAEAKRTINSIYMLYIFNASNS